MLGEADCAPWMQEHSHRGMSAERLLDSIVCSRQLVLQESMRLHRFGISLVKLWKSKKELVLGTHECTTKYNASELVLLTSYFLSTYIRSSLKHVDNLECLKAQVQILK